MEKKKSELKPAYEAPAIVELGSVHELTLWQPCNKIFGSTDGFTFHGVQIVCSA